MKSKHRFCSLLTFGLILTALLVLVGEIGITFLPIGIRVASAEVAQPAPLRGGPDLPNQVISAGGDHSCGIKSDGTLLCWGKDNYGQTTVPAGTYTQVSAGGYHTCGLQSDGTLVCWGMNLSGQTTVPAGTYTQVSAGNNHTCGLKDDDTLLCWGGNDYGQTIVPAGSYTQVSAGGHHTCGLKDDGTLLCWGRNDHERTTVPAGTYTQVSAGWAHTCGLQRDGTLLCWGDDGLGQTLVPPATYTQVSAGGTHTCGLKGDGTLVCWGLNNFGQIAVPAGSYTQVSAGGGHTCGLKGDGTLLCWGTNDNGQTTVPTRNFIQVNAGGAHTCGLQSDGTLLCWGNNDDGQTTVPAGIYTQVSAGQYHTCGLKDDDTLLCWGKNDDGQSTVPAGSYTQVSAGGAHTCGLKDDGTLLCWGKNDDGQTTVPAGSYIQVSAGEYHTCGRLHGSLICWGNNDYGQTTAPLGVFAQVSAGSNHTCGLSLGGLECWGLNDDGQTTVPAWTYTQVSAGDLHTCGLKDDNSLLCWGDNSFGQTTVPAGIYSQVSAGGAHTCGLQDDGSLLCWGLNDDGQTINPPPFTYGIDTTPPSVISSTRADTDPTDEASVDFTVTFSEFVVGVNTSDFSLTTTGGISGAAVTSVIGAGSIYTVSVDTGTGDGTIRLDVLADDSIRDAFNLPLDGGCSSGQFYTIDKTPPTVISSTRADGDPSGEVNVDFTVTFSESVTGVDSTDFDLTTTGTISGHSIAAVAGGGDTYTVTVDTGTGDGTIGLLVLDDDSIRDAANLPLDSGYFSGEYYTIEKSSILFEDDFENNNFDAWTRFNDGKGFLYTCGQAAIHGSYGACVERGTNDKRKQLIDDSPINETAFNARFNFDINNLSMTTGERFRFMQIKMDALRPAFIVLKYDSGVYSIQLNTLLDNLTKVKTGWVVLPNAPTTIEVEWQQSSGGSANDGFARLYLNDVLQDELTGLDNFTLSITSFRMGFTSRLAGKSISGIFYIDDVATSTGGHIGPP